MPPQLLVSVRSPEEAIIAAECGVPIIDFKEPNSGSLGMLNSRQIHECVSVIRDVNSNLQCSAALGEAVDWLDTEFAPDFQLPQLDYLKLGLSGLANDSEWENQWLSIRSRIESRLENSSPVAWIAVAYVDAETAHSPNIDEVISAATESNCRGVLFDTFEKSNLRFSDWVSDSELFKHLETIHNAGMFCSVAGRLHAEDIQRLAKLPVDVLAVRSAACNNGNRIAELSEAKIRQLQNSIEQFSQSELDQLST